MGLARQGARSWHSIIILAYNFIRGVFYSMRHLALATLLTIAIAGCANVNDLRKKDPVFFATTAKTSEAYADCLAASWRQDGIQVQVAKIRNGYDIYIEGRFNVEQVARVQHYDSKTHISMYTRLNYRVQ